MIDGRLLGILIAATCISIAGCSEDTVNIDASVGQDARADQDAMAADAERSDLGPADAGQTCTSTGVPPSAERAVLGEPVNYETPNPSGSFAVGTHFLELTDEDRLEASTDDPSDARRFVVQLFYPTDVTGAPIAALIEDEVAAIVGPPNGLTADYHTRIRTKAQLDVPLSSRMERYPLILYSHGLGGHRSDNITLVQELASRGYVVAAISHTYSSIAVVFEDGTVARSSLPPPPQTAAQYETFLAELDERIHRDWLPDQQHVIDELTRRNAAPCDWLSGRLDLESIGAIGYSFGGATSLLLCTNDPRCDGAVNLDGANFFSDVPITTKPLMMFLSERSDNTWESLHAELEGEAYLARVSDATHGNFTSNSVIVSALFPNATPQQLGLGTIDPAHAIDIYQTYSLAFFDKYLKNGAGEILAMPVSPFDEVFYELTRAGQSPYRIAMFGRLSRRAGFGAPTPIMGAVVTSLHDPRTTTTDTNGEFRLDDVTGATMIGARITHDSILPHILSVPSRGRSVLSQELPFFSRQEFEAFASARGVVLRPDRGHVVLDLAHGKSGQLILPEAGVEVTSTSTRATTHYLGVNGIDPMLTTTGPRGLAVIFNLPPGDWTATATHPDRTCTALPSGAPESPGDVTLRIVEGSVSVRWVSCEE
jgi:dienelactone hydrolase